MRQMTRITTKLSNVWLLLFFLLVLSSLISCSKNKVECPPHQGIVTPLPGMPNAFEKIWPGPGEVIDLDCFKKGQDANCSNFRRGVGASLSIMYIDLNLFEEPPTPVYLRTELYVDGEKISRNTFQWVEDLLAFAVTYKNGTTTPERSAGYDVSWLPDLKVGKHEARLEVARDNGEVIEYTWHFTLR